MTKPKAVWHASQEIAFIKSLRNQLARLSDDQQSLRDALEHELETDQLDAIMNGLLHERNVALAIAADRERYAEQLKEEAATSKVYAGQITTLIGEGMRAAQQRNWEGTLGSVSRGEGQLLVEAEEGKVDLDFYKPVLDRSLLNQVALDIHKRREAIECDATLAKSEREQALAKLPQLKGVTVKRGPGILKVHSGAGKGDDE